MPNYIEVIYHLFVTLNLKFIGNNKQQEANANDIISSNGVDPTHNTKGAKLDFKNSVNTVVNSNNIDNVNMEYASNAAWIHEIGSRGSQMESALTHHDPIITDTNLAEIDFEDFRNEDLAYAFSCGVSHLQIIYCVSF